MDLHVLEHHLTSADLTAQTGQRGYQPVAKSRELSKANLLQLKNLSAYTYPPPDWKRPMPVIYSGAPLDDDRFALSRIALREQVDFSGRSGVYYARNVILECAELKAIDYDVFSLLRDEALFSEPPSQIPAEFPPRTVVYASREAVDPPEISAVNLALAIDACLDAGERRSAYLFIADPEMGFQLLASLWLAIPVVNRARLSFRTFIDVPRRYEARWSLLGLLKGSGAPVLGTSTVDTLDPRPTQTPMTRYAAAAAANMLQRDFRTIEARRRVLDGLSQPITTNTVDAILDIGDKVRALTEAFEPERFREAGQYFVQQAAAGLDTDWFWAEAGCLLQIRPPVEHLAAYADAVLPFEPLLARNEVRVAWTTGVITALITALQQAVAAYDQMANDLFNAASAAHAPMRESLAEVIDGIMPEVKAMLARPGQSITRGEALAPTLTLLRLLSLERRRALVAELLAVTCASEPSDTLIVALAEEFARTLRSAPHSACLADWNKLVVNLVETQKWPAAIASLRVALGESIGQPTATPPSTSHAYTPRSRQTNLVTRATAQSGRAIRASSVTDPMLLAIIREIAPIILSQPQWGRVAFGTWIAAIELTPGAGAILAAEAYRHAPREDERRHYMDQFRRSLAATQSLSAMEDILAYVREGELPNLYIHALARLAAEHPSLGPGRLGDVIERRFWKDVMDHPPLLAPDALAVLVDQLIQQTRPSVRQLHRLAQALSDITRVPMLPVPTMAEAKVAFYGLMMDDVGQFPRKVVYETFKRYIPDMPSEAARSLLSVCDYMWRRVTDESGLKYINGYCRLMGHFDGFTPIETSILTYLNWLVKRELNVEQLVFFIIELESSPVFAYCLRDAVRLIADQCAVSLPKLLDRLAADQNALQDPEHMEMIRAAFREVQDESIANKPADQSA